ncbi:hypothetical protein ACIPLC_26735 [Kitasatospora sp. NPDC086801]|uniref:hypothetical protein n=1 Tax=Kitasatospora sp. NPDC086801 TaxID=3364066 RepID=UPI00382B339E
MAYYWGMLKAADLDGLRAMTNAVSTFEGHFKTRITQWQKVQRDLASSSWHGHASDSTDGALQERTSQLFLVDQVIEDLRMVLTDAVDTLLLLQARQKALVEDAAADGLQIVDGDENTAPVVRILPPGKGDEAARHDPEWAKAMGAARDRLAKSVDDLSGEVKAMDDAVTQALGRLDTTFRSDGDFTPDRVAGVRKDVTDLDRATNLKIGGVPAAGGPGGNRKWWDSLPESTRQQLLQDHPGQIGALQGLPAQTLDQANRLYLPRLRAQITQGLADPDTSLHATQTDLDGLDALQKQIDTATNPPQFLLRVDTPMNQPGPPAAVIAYGNPDTATNIAAYVPPNPAAGTMATDAATARALAVAAGKADPTKTTASLVFTSLGPPGDPGLTPRSVPGRPLRESSTASGTYYGLAVSHQGKGATVSEISATPDGSGPGYAVARSPLDSYGTGLPDPCTPDAVVAGTSGGLDDPSARHTVVDAIVGRR